MRTEKQKMLAGELYDPLDAELSRDRARCRELCQMLTATGVDRHEERQRLLSEIIGDRTDVWVQPPFFCDYGTDIVLGKKVFFNFNRVVLDVAQVTIGDHVLLGPAVQIYTATHPISALERRKWLESAEPMTIGSDVWVGGGAIICPGVRIGDWTVLGAGSVVTHNIPADVIAAGNPARIIRKLPQEPPR